MKLLFVGFTNQQIADYRKIAAPAEIVTLDTGAEGEVPDIGAEALIGATRAVFDKVFTPETWRIRPSIRWYHAPGAGIEFYMFPGIADQSFVLTNGKLIQGPEVADHAVGLLLALTRRLLWSLKAPGAEMSRPVELRGKRALVIGLGGIGMLVAERLAGFGMQIDTVTEDYVPFLGFIQRRWMSDQLLDALPSADVVIMAAPLTTMSKKMMGSAAFDRMKQGSYFVNVSRGGTVDTESLLAA
ncbi:MAG: hypothetical protein FJX42_12245, partial [Alphaproteobacteria bacterium]|nr:hypothetical protein [Alphaproteobacteria bacterium]